MAILWSVILALNFLFAANEGKFDVITDPAISKRCDALKEQRQEKMTHKQKIIDLMNRAIKIENAASKKRDSAHKKLQRTYKSLKVELDFTENRVEQLEETIVRQGCPGIVL